VESGERELFPPLPHLHPPPPPPPPHLQRIWAPRESPPPRHPRSRPGGSPKPPPLLPCLPPFIIGTIGLPPAHIFRQSDPLWGATRIPKILHKNAHALRKQKLTQSDENELKQTHPGADDPSR
jgi:hypothetical protein